MLPSAKEDKWLWSRSRGSKTGEKQWNLCHSVLIYHPSLPPFLLPSSRFKPCTFTHLLNIFRLCAVQSLQPLQMFSFKLNSTFICIMFNTMRFILFYWFFFPRYILQYENLLRRVDCRVTVPYWDWSIVSMTPWHTDKTRVWYSGPSGLGGNGITPSRCVQDGVFGQDSWTKTNGGCITRDFNG